MLRFKIDINMPVEAASVLNDSGHNALTIHDQQMVGETDTQIGYICKPEHRALVTLDLDFSDIRTYPPREHPGIVLL